MVYRSLYYDSDIPDSHVSMVLTIDNMIERGYSLDNCERIGFSLPSTPELPLILAGVTRGKQRYDRQNIRDSESKARMRQ